MRCIVSGRVQGVFFRASTKQQAQALGLTGYAKNLADGRVEVLTCGDRHGLAKLRSWLAEGPPMAIVDDVECESVEAQIPEGFSTF